MAFVLAERSVLSPFGEDGERDPAFDDYAASVVRAAMDEGGRVLVLTPSFADVDEMARRIEGIVAHRRGEALSVHLDNLRSSPGGVLVTPAAWAGTDLPGLLDHVVISPQSRFCRRTRAASTFFAGSWKRAATTVQMQRAFFTGGIAGKRFAGWRRASVAVSVRSRRPCQGLDRRSEIPLCPTPLPWTRDG